MNDYESLCKLSYITQHFFFKILLKKKKISIENAIEINAIEINPGHEVKTTWSLIDEIIVYIKMCYDSSSDFSPASEYRDLRVRIFSENIFCSEKNVLCKLFRNELNMQKNILPKIEKLLKSKIGPGLHSYSHRLKIFFLEDLSNQRYLVKSFDKGLNFNYCVNAIQLMAKFHAASVALHEQNPDLIEAFKIDGILTVKSCERLMEIFRDSMQKTIAFIDKIYPIIAIEMKMVADRIYTMQQIIDLYNYEPEEFCVLNNGDFSINNVIFSKDSSFPPLLQHFQMANYSSPAIDLHYFLNTSPETAVIYDQDKQVLTIYLATLTNTMKMLNCKTKPLTMGKLKAAMRKRELYAVFAGMTFKLNMLSDKIEENTENINHGKNPYEELAKKMCLTMFNRNYFDNFIIQT